MVIFTLLFLFFFVNTPMGLQLYRMQPQCVGTGHHFYLSKGSARGSGIYSRWIARHRPVDLTGV